MGPESLTPNWGRNCIDRALLSCKQPNGYCMLEGVVDSRGRKGRKEDKNRLCERQSASGGR